MELKKIKKIVEECLSEDIAARNSDWILFADVCRKLGIDISNITVEQMCVKHNDLNFPSFESVRRTRQKAQEMGKFKPSEEIKKFRNKQEDEYYKEFKNA